MCDSVGNNSYGLVLLSTIIAAGIKTLCLVVFSAGTSHRWPKETVCLKLNMTAVAFLSTCLLYKSKSWTWDLPEVLPATLTRLPSLILLDSVVGRGRRCTSRSGNPPRLSAGQTGLTSTTGLSRSSRLRLWCCVHGRPPELAPPCCWATDL